VVNAGSEVWCILNTYVSQFPIFHLTAHTIFSMLNTKEVLFITSSAVKGFSVHGDEAKELVSLSWTPETIGRVLETARSAMGRSVRLLMGEPFAYVATLFVSEQEKEVFASLEKEREAVFQLAGKLVPEELEKTTWDYREVSLPAASLGRPVEVVAVIASFARIVVPAVKSAGFRVLEALPESCAIASLFADRKEAILVVCKSDGIFVAGVIGGIVLSSVTSLGVVNFEAVENVRRFVEHRFALSIKTIVFVGDFSERELSDFEREKAESVGLSLEFSKKTALLGCAEKRDISGDDRSVLSIKLDVPEISTVASDDAVTASEEMEAAEDRFRPHTLDERPASDRSGDVTGKVGGTHRVSRKTWTLAASFLVVLTCGVAAIGLLKKGQEREKETSDRARQLETSVPPDVSPVNSIPEKAVETVPAPSEEPVAFNRASFRIAIENASGVAGAAGRLQEILTKEEFVVIRVGNAESKEIAPSVRAKASVPDAFVDELISVSGLEASLDRRVETLEASEADVTIVIGKK